MIARAHHNRTKKRATCNEHPARRDEASAIEEMHRLERQLFADHSELEAGFYELSFEDRLALFDDEARPKYWALEQARLALRAFYQKKNRAPKRRGSIARY
jgi:hypothetical protein